MPNANQRLANEVVGEIRNSDLHKRVTSFLPTVPMSRREILAIEADRAGKQKYGYAPGPPAPGFDPRRRRDALIEANEIKQELQAWWCESGERFLALQRVVQVHDDVTPQGKELRELCTLHSARENLQRETTLASLELLNECAPPALRAEMNSLREVVRRLKKSCAVDVAIGAVQAQLAKLLKDADARADEIERDLLTKRSDELTWS